MRGSGLLAAALLLLLLLELTVAQHCLTEEEDCRIMEGKMMKSISHNTSDASVELATDTPVPLLKDGEVLIKVDKLFILMNNFKVSIGLSCWSE